MTTAPPTGRDLRGKRYGRLTVVSFVETVKRQRIWQCQCACGQATFVATSKLNAGHTKSCGCLLRDSGIAAGHRNRRHGMSRTPIYRIWAAMRNRCHRPNVKGYDRYGGRGITVCDRWRTSFENFYADMGPRPDDGQRWSIERKDKDGPYCPENCVWALDKQQARNKRDNHVLEFRGVSRCLAEWEEQTGIPQHVIRKRLKRGWSVERALTTPVLVRSAA